MSESPLTITFAAPAAAEPKNLLKIEQESWAALTGQVTRAEMVRYLASLIYGTEYRSGINCGLVDGEVVCVLQVYPRVGPGWYISSTPATAASAHRIVNRSPRKNRSAFASIPPLPHHTRRGISSPQPGSLSATMPPGRWLKRRH